ncbi:MAG: SDR family oxidoreductase [Candidatus Ancaeobacter aquaticus]|nr:SDR family oxidoreductase [Candidatus Ancaeobacter aquaticus]
MVNPIFNLKNKNIIITGASSGIGRQCAITLSQLGANVILIARNKERLKDIFNKLKKGNHLILSQDITEYAKLEEVVNTAVDKIGRISGFVHSAGTEVTLPLRSMKPSYYEEIFSVNVIAGFELAKIISKKKYINKEGASFVFISSVMGILGQSGKIAYCSSKGALTSGVKAMALELAPKNIKVNCVLPGVVETEMSNKMFENLSEESKKLIINMHPLGLGKTEDIASACAFLLSDAAKWIIGINLIVDGGYSAR